jgi:hypothetical protein
MRSSNNAKTRNTNSNFAYSPRQIQIGLPVLLLDRSILESGGIKTKRLANRRAAFFLQWLNY